jgi:hypothetical protein|tara:strand:- start:1547 stop:1867 length:321 start_codon:yes stop_codon:yes gene_type:complete
MVVGDTHAVGVSILPLEANSPLVVDADTVLALSVAFLLLKVVAWNCRKVRKAFGAMQDRELPLRPTLDVARKFSRVLPSENTLGFAIVEAPNHAENITRRVINIKH